MVGSAGEAAATAAVDEAGTERKETGALAGWAAGGESAGEAAATAAVDEDNAEGKETGPGAAGGGSAGETAIAEED